jgi:hypothetical protein
MWGGRPKGQGGVRAHGDRPCVLRTDEGLKSHRQGSGSHGRQELRGAALDVAWHLLVAVIIRVEGSGL